MNVRGYKSLFLYAAREKEMYESVLTDIQRDNRRSMMMYTMLGGSLFFILSVASLFSSALRFPSWGFFVISLILFSMTAVCHYLIPKHQDYIDLMVWFFELLLYVLGALLSLSHPEYPAVTLVALLIVIPMMFFIPPYRMALFIFTVLGVFLCISFRVKNHEVWAMDFWNGLCMAALSVPISANLRILKVRALYEAKRADYLSRIDVLTGTKNRNCYEEDSREEKSAPYSLIFADVNGLHEKNNTEGHEAGDAMLKEVAQQMKDFFGREQVYRIGGDEFVAIVPRMKKEKLDLALQSLAGALAAKQIHVAFGFADGEKGEDLIEVQKKAEEIMYLDKKTWYQQQQHDRRKRR